MLEPLFQNSATTRAHRERLRTILTHPENLPLWDAEIVEVNPEADGFRILRRSPALNTEEHVTVRTTPNKVIYQSQGGRLAYQLVFTLGSAASQTTITEALTVPTTDKLPVPLRLLAPIAKQAFAQNLQAFVTLAESSLEVTD
ncbi:SRPBCC family protein [Levilactobacillus sp. N40-8-2]|uniref:SRPBCC family protein n=1 Tax=Levilactobacillus muriae TaxID=3238987 RepID=UPI0038B2A67B